MDTKKLWQERFQAYLRVFLGYMRLIGNSGFLFSVFFLILFGSYYYSLLIKQIPEAFPVMLLVTVILTFFLVRSPIRTFLKRADLVFLLAAEERMKAYFTASVIYNILLQVFALLLVAIVLAPLYNVRADTASYPYFILIILFLMVKAWNVGVNWFLLRFQSGGDMTGYTVLRTVATFIFVLLALEGASAIFLVIIAVIMVLFWLYLSNVVTKHYSVKWERLIAIDEELLMRFYRIANAFTDVPKLRQRVKPRKWLNIFTKPIPYQQASVPLFLYVKAFLRAGDYFGIYTRLLVIGALVLLVVPSGYGRFIGFLLFLYLSAVQLLPLVHHFSGQEMLRLYPISRLQVHQSFQRLLFLLLSFQTIVYAVVLLLGGSSIGTVVVLLVAGISLSYSYLRLALKSMGKGAFEA